MGFTLNPFTGQFDNTGSSGGGGSSPTIGGPITGGTNGSVIFVSPANTLSQDNPDFIYDPALNKLTVAGSVVTPSLIANSLDRGSAGTLSIGTSVNSSIINIGNAGATINMIGTTLYENVTVLNVSNPIINLNVGGGVGSGSNSGINIQENAIVTGYAETSADRNSWIFKAPNTAGIATITPGAGGITLDQSSHNPVTIGTANGLSLATQVLSLGLSSTSTTGALSSTDWNTFNNGVTNAANRALSNLTTTSINQTLLPDVSDSRNIGSGALRWDALFVGRLTAPSGNDIILLTTRQLRNTSNSTVLDFSGTDPSLNTHKLTNVVDPTAAQDAATKNYVDTQITANSGANKTLSNLTTTAINTSLIFGTALNGIIQSEAAATSSNMTLTTGVSSAGSSGTGNLRSGNGTTGSGAVIVQSGSASSTGGTSGLVSVKSANGGGTNSNTGNTTLATGDGTGTGTSGNVDIHSGSSGTGGTTGNITLTLGTPTSGTRGKLIIVDGSEGTAGQVWTSTDTTGKGAWVAATTGANQALSNLASVAINTALLPGANNTIDLGSNSFNFKDGYIRNLKDGSGGFLSIAVQNRSLNSTTGALVASFATTGILVLPGGNKLELDGLTSGNIQISAADTTTSYAVKMPNAQGAASTFLQNDGSGNLSWTAATAGANTALSNLTATSINQDLIPTAADAHILGSGAKRWGQSYIAGLLDSTGALVLDAVGRGLYNTVNTKLLGFNSTNLDFQALRATNLANPTSAQDAATKSYVDSAVGVTGDITQTSFTAADNQATPANVTGFAFANGVTRSFDALVSIVRSSTYASYKLYGIQKGASWDLNSQFVGDTTGIVFSITAAGQVQYTSTSTGSTALLKFRAITTSV